MVLRILQLCVFMILIVTTRDIYFLAVMAIIVDPTSRCMFCTHCVVPGAMHGDRLQKDKHHQIHDIRRRQSLIVGTW